MMFNIFKVSINRLSLWFHIISVGILKFLFFILKVSICDWFCHQHRLLHHDDTRASYLRDSDMCAHSALDHLEMFFNSIRASGGWNNNPTVAHFQSYFWRIMVPCGIAPGKTGNVQAQDDTMCLSAVDMSSVVPAEDDDDNIASSPFEQITGVVLDHSYLATSFGCLTENAIVYIAGFVVRQVMRKLACNECRSSLVASAIPSFGDKYHLLTLRNNGGLKVLLR
ncbi:hypothetical protein UPYG_G00343430 [Umbra pygmaea]|uniref:Transposable element P transposase-like RNase H C-terminal domain-containing protein n=1 Tax=Umbra pygmaea TaxID=75934 RepID=A0ABD0VY21_UMBPY